MKYRNNKLCSTGKIYDYLLSFLLSKDQGIDPEKLSEIALYTLKYASLNRLNPILGKVFSKLKDDLIYQDKRLEQKVFGCHFPSPIGLSAGFDKNGVAAAIWDYFGFGFAELGTVTWHSQTGNQKPRLFRLANEQAALNRMGFNNEGAYAVRRNIDNQNIEQVGQRNIPIGINLGKSKITELKDAAEDYALSMKELGDIADYIVVNVSSPNTPGLRELQSVAKLRELINKLQDSDNPPPLLIKIAPDLSDEEIEDIAKMSVIENVSGLIAVNTSINRFNLKERVIKQTGLTLEQESGGLSGLPLRARAIEVIRLLRKSVGFEIPLIGVGGIDSAESAWERITAGASLIQVYTGWIYKGPGLVPSILEGLISQLDRHQMKSISEAIGSEAPWIDPENN